MIDLVAGRGELTDTAWERIAPLLPQVDGRGRPWRNHRQVVNGVLWRLRTGAPWRDLPERYGPWQTVYERFARWEADGTWAKLLEHVQVRDDAVGRVEWTVAVDQPRSSARGRRPQKGDADGDELEDPGSSQTRQALGRSRGGLTTKVHLAVDGRGLPLPIVLTPGNVNDATTFVQVLDGIRIPRAMTGRPRTTPDRVLGDKAYSSRAIRHLLRRRGIVATIPERRDQAANRRRRGTSGGRPPAFDRNAYRDRNVVERCFARLKQFRAIATRFDKLAARYRAGLVLASLVLWLREPTR
ncbi:IS5 family transposase [Streptomyces sp. NBC_01285]|uniref:IS5 family transposase n=1 Tax=unclassified Streptomyces TaxID=2593676 RepID=UPI0022590779|nr:IS5 family transposase [Streptomyces sp. NBC_01285]MCX4774484.1 IS5 family transposase [Streptomyces sp. NBC_01285]